jgi:hypothetical protein
MNDMTFLLALPIFYALGLAWNKFFAAPRINDIIDTVSVSHASNPEVMQLVNDVKQFAGDTVKFSAMTDRDMDKAAILSLLADIENAKR